MIRNLADSAVVAYSSKGKLAALSPSANKRLAVYNARAYNNSGSTLSVGICRLIASQGSQYRLWTLQGGVYTEVTNNLSGGQNLFTTTNNDGFIIQSTRRIGLVGFTISSASAAGTFTYTYSTSPSAFSTVTTVENPTDYSATGDNFVVIRPPSDWVVGGNANLDQNMYSLKLLATTHPTSAVAITSMWLGEFLDLYSGVSNNSAVQISFPDSKPFELQGGEGLFPYFSTANAANSFGSYHASID
jgi:hypothetical protein